MLSVRKTEILSSGVIGAALIVLGWIMYMKKENSIISVVFGFITLIYVVGNLIFTILKKKSKKIRLKTEPWDELARENYAKARKTTLLCIETIMSAGVILFTTFDITLHVTTGTLLVAYGVIEIIRTIAFLYHDMRSVQV